MKASQSIMGMPVAIEIVDDAATIQDIEDVFTYFRRVDERFSTYKPESEISKIRAGTLGFNAASDDMKHIFALAEQTKQDTHGYFDIEHEGTVDPSGIVKGWAIWQAALQLRQKGFQNFYVDIGADIEVGGHDAEGKKWRIGISNPIQPETIVKVLTLSDCGVATSGTAKRGQHIYNPHNPGAPIVDVVSMTVIARNVYEADRFATAAFAMGKAGIAFIERMPGVEGYCINAAATATYTSGFEQYIV